MKCDYYNIVVSDLIDEIKRRVDILSLIGKYTRLTRKGNRYWACCPFHQEKTPSFTVNVEEGFFKCFGCGLGGNAIKFIQLAENLDFSEAIDFLVRELNIDRHQYSKYKHEPGAKSDRDMMFKAHTIASHFFVENLLKTTFGSQVQDYLTLRSISPSIARTFMLGVSLDAWNSLSDYLVKQGISQTILIKCGLGAFSDRDLRLYDRFRARLMFPIKDRHGQVIAFGGRALKEGDEPKYLNTGATPIYDKSNTLYGLDLSSSEIKQQKSVVLVEGYVDLISFWICGIKNVVASCGTALTAQQARTISRLSDNIYICYDGDLAGTEAAIKAVKLFLEIGFLPKIIKLPENMDPDDVRMKLGAEGLVEIYHQPISSMNFICNYFIQKNGREKEGQKRTLDAVCDIIKISTEALYIEEMSNEAGYMLNISRDLILSRMPKSKPLSSISPLKSNQSTSIEGTMENEIISLMSRNLEIRKKLLPVINCSLTDQEMNSKLLLFWQNNVDYEDYNDQLMMDHHDLLATNELTRIKNFEDSFWGLVKLMHFRLDNLEGIAETQFKKVMKDDDQSSKNILRSIKNELLKIRKQINIITESSQISVLIDIKDQLEKQNNLLIKKGAA